MIKFSREGTPLHHFGWLISRINVFFNLLDSRTTLGHPFVFGLILSVNNLVVSLTLCFSF
jgi:hypothetical protein